MPVALWGSLHKSQNSLPAVECKARPAAWLVTILSVLQPKRVWFESAQHNAFFVLSVSDSCLTTWQNNNRVTSLFVTILRKYHFFFLIFSPCCIRRMSALNAATRI